MGRLTVRIATFHPNEAGYREDAKLIEATL